MKAGNLTHSSKFWIFTLMGTINLTFVVARALHHRDVLVGLPLFTILLAIVTIWVSFLRLDNGLTRVREQIGEKAGRRLQTSAESLGFGLPCDSFRPIICPLGGPEEMFEYFVNRIRDVGEEKVDREWFRGEEFQTLLYEALNQLHVTRDREKIEMLGVSLANSGAPGFKGDDRNDLFVRFVRDLTPQHIRLLIRLAPQPIEFQTDLTPPPSVPSLPEETIQRLTWDRRPTLTPHNDDLLTLQMLHAYGLVQEFLSSSVEEPRFSSGHITASEISSAIRKFVKQLQESPVRSFRISELGRDFLSFMGLPKKGTTPPKP